MDMKVVADLIAESWDEIEPSTIQKSWRKIIASSVQQPDQERETPSEEQSSPGGIGEKTSSEGQNSSRDVTEREFSEDQGSSSDVVEFIDPFRSWDTA